MYPYYDIYSTRNAQVLLVVDVHDDGDFFFVMLWQQTQRSKKRPHARHFL